MSSTKKNVIKANESFTKQLNPNDARVPFYKDVFVKNLESLILQTDNNIKSLTFKEDSDIVCISFKDENKKTIEIDVKNTDYLTIVSLVSKTILDYKK